MDARAAPHLDLILAPHRSLTPAGFWAVMGVLIAANFVAGVMFLALGAWPVLGFLGLDVVLVYWAFRINFRRGQAQERLRLDAAALTVERRDARGRHDTVTFAPPHWLRVIVEDGPGGLVLSSHGRHLTVGAFLSPEERVAVADTIRAALARLAPVQASPSTSFMP